MSRSLVGSSNSRISGFSKQADQRDLCLLAAGEISDLFCLSAFWKIRNPVKIRSFLLIFKPFPCKGNPETGAASRISSTVCSRSNCCRSIPQSAGGARHAEPLAAYHPVRKAPPRSGEAAYFQRHYTPHQGNLFISLYLKIHMGQNHMSARRNGTVCNLI